MANQRRQVSRGQYGRNAGHKNWGVGKGVILRNTPNLAQVGAGAAGAFVQNVFEGGAQVFTTTDTTLITAAVVAAGNVLLIAHANDGIVPTSVTCPGATPIIVKTGLRCHVVMVPCPAGLASGTTITFNFATQVSRPAYRADEFTNLASSPAPSGGLIAYSGIVATNTPDAGNTGLLSTIKDIEFGAFSYAGTSPKADWTPGAGWTALGGAVAGAAAQHTVWSEYRVGDGGAADAKASTSDPAVNMEAIGVIFRGSATSPGAAGRRNMWINGGLDG